MMTSQIATMSFLLSGKRDPVFLATYVNTGHVTITEYPFLVKRETSLNAENE